MRWDIFCKVIDNHGDLGVCWRLSAQLAALGDRVRLWVDDGSALAWMAPGGCAGVEVIDWSDAAATRAATPATLPDVIVEAFGCDPEPGVLQRFAAAGGGQGWINLEYLSAEPQVERLHRLPSPVFHGPGAGLTKHFFYPGFTPATGGLLREPELFDRQARFDRAGWLAAHGVVWGSERVVSMFCYEPTALPGLLAQWAAGHEPIRLLVTAGRAADAVRAGMPTDRGRLVVDYLPPVPQTAFDELLWSCDLNFVRGEDSLVRALWAGKPLVWQIYPQEDGAHHAKLGAFLDTIGAPPSMRTMHADWNGISGRTAAAPDGGMLADWSAAVRSARDRLRAQPDLAGALRAFCSAAGRRLPA